jgi:PucR C-terminal helix-turn-helix domain/GGDEF-like domain
MSSDGALAALAAGLFERLDVLAAEAAALIRKRIEFYRDSPIVSDAELRDNLRANLSNALAQLAAPGRPFVGVEARETGRHRASAGVPLPAVMDAYRVGSRYFWSVLLEAAAESGTVSSDDLVAAASDVWIIQDEFTQAMVSGYREEQTVQILAQERERLALIEALLEGRVTESATLWEVADVLRIAKKGPYVLVAAELQQVGRQCLPGVEAALHVADVNSAWRLTPDLQVGIVCIPRPEHLTRVLTTLRRLATSSRVGVSPSFDDLSGTAGALRLARIAMAGSLVERSPVTVFDRDSLAVLAVAAPEVNRRIATTVLAGLDAVPGHERAVLLDTLEAWLDCNGSTAETAEKIFCHHNTVRHRLHRIEHYTGKSLSVPRDLTALCLALEVDRRLPAVSPDAPAGHDLR